MKNIQHNLKVLAYKVTSNCAHLLILRAHKLKILNRNDNGTMYKFVIFKQVISTGVIRNYIEGQSKLLIRNF